MTDLDQGNFRWELRIVLSMCVGYGMLMLCRTVLGVAGPAMLLDPVLDLDKASFGAILGWGTAGNLVGKLTNGVLADRFGGSRVFIAVIAIAAVTTFIFGTLSGTTAFSALYFLTIFGKSAGWPSMANIIRVGFSKPKHGRVWGFIATSSRASSVATTLLLSSLLAVMAWRGLFFVAAGLALTIALVLPRFLKDPSEAAEEPSSDTEQTPDGLGDGSSPHPLKELEAKAALRYFIRSQRFWLISLGVASLAVLFEFQVFIPIYLSETFNLAPAQAGLASAAFPFGCLVAVFSGGFVFDKLSKKQITYVMGGTLVLALLCLVMLWFLGTADLGDRFELALTIGLIFTFGFAISPAYYLPMSIFSIDFGGRHCGLLVGLIDALAYFGVMLFDFLGGVVANKEGGWQDFILILIVTSIASTVIMVSFLYQEYKAETGDQRPLHVG